MNHIEGSGNHFIDWSDYPAKPIKSSMDDLKLLWETRCYIRNNFEYFPGGIRNIISEYLTDVWTPKSSDVDNSTYFLTRTINQRIVSWFPMQSAILCRVQQHHYGSDAILLKKELDGEFTVTDICLACLGNCKLDEIGLSDFSVCNWSATEHCTWIAELDCFNVKTTDYNRDIIIDPNCDD